jgi:hypothetical protein
LLPAPAQIPACAANAPGYEDAAVEGYSGGISDLDSLLVTDLGARSSPAAAKRCASIFRFLNLAELRIHDATSRVCAEQQKWRDDGASEDDHKCHSGIRLRSAGIVPTAR